MATNSGRTAQNFVMNKIRESEEEGQHTGMMSDRHQNGGVSRSLENLGPVQEASGTMESQGEAQMHHQTAGTVASAGKTQPAGVEGSSENAAEAIVIKEGSETSRKKSKKHKKHKGKKKKKKRKEEKDSSSESGVESDREAHNQASLKNHALLVKEDRGGCEGNADVQDPPGKLLADLHSEKDDGKTKKQKHSSKKKKKKKRKGEKKSPSYSRSESTSVSGTESESECKPPLLSTQLPLDVKKDQASPMTGLSKADEMKTSVAVLENPEERKYVMTLENLEEQECPMVTLDKPHQRLSSMASMDKFEESESTVMLSTKILEAQDEREFSDKSNKHEESVLPVPPQVMEEECSQLFSTEGETGITYATECVQNQETPQSTFSENCQANVEKGFPIVEQDVSMTKDNVESLENTADEVNLCKTQDLPDIIPKLQGMHDEDPVRREGISKAKDGNADDKHEKNNGSRSRSRSRSKSLSKVTEEASQKSHLKKSLSRSRSPKRTSGKTASRKDRSASKRRSRSTSRRKSSLKKHSRSRSRRRKSRSRSIKRSGRRSRSYSPRRSWRSRSRSRNRRTRSRSPRRSRRTRSRSVVRVRRSRSRSRFRHRQSRSRSKRSRSRRRSRSTRRGRRSRSRSRSHYRRSVSRSRRSVSRSYRRTRRTRSRSIVILRRSRSRSLLKRYRRSRSRSLRRNRSRSLRRRRSKSRSPRQSRRSRSRSRSRRRRSKSRSLRRNRSKSRSPQRNKRSKSKSPGRRHRSKSKSPKDDTKLFKSPKRTECSKSVSPSRSKSRSRSISKDPQLSEINLSHSGEQQATVTLPPAVDPLFEIQVKELHQETSEEPDVFEETNVKSMDSVVPVEKEDHSLQSCCPEENLTTLSVESSEDTTEAPVTSGSWKPVPFLNICEKPKPAATTEKQVALLEAKVTTDVDSYECLPTGQSEEYYASDMPLTVQDVSDLKVLYTETSAEETSLNISELNASEDENKLATTRSGSVSPHSDDPSELLLPLPESSVTEEKDFVSESKVDTDESQEHESSVTEPECSSEIKMEDCPRSSVIECADGETVSETKASSESKKETMWSSESPKRKTRSKSRSASRRKKSKSRSVTRRKHSRSRSSSAKKASSTRKKKSKSKSPGRKRKSRSPSRGRRRKSKSKSPARKRRSRSRSTRRRKSRSKSAARAKRSRSRSVKKRRSKSRSPTRKNRSKSRSPRRTRRSKSRSPARRRKSKSSEKSKRSKSRSPAKKRRSRSRSATRNRRSRSRRSRSISRRRRYGFRSRSFDRRDRWKREPSHSPILILRKKRSTSRSRRSSSKTPPRLTDLDKDQLLEIAKANAAAMCAKAGMPIPESLKPKAILQLPLPTPVPSPLNLPLPLPMNLPMNLPMGMPNISMNAAMATMTAATMTAALSNMGALASMPALPTITNKPPPVPVPNTANIEEAKRKVTQTANSISIKELTEKCKQIAESKEEMAIAQPHVSDDED